MVKNSLELHLQTICNENPEYVSLLSTWNLNKKTCVDALKTVVASYPHYSMHDVSHAEAVVTKIEMLLGERIQTLSPTDTWLILHAAYAHDLGMVLKWEDIEKIWKDGKFSRFLDSMINSSDGQLSTAAKTIQAALSGSKDNDVRTDPLQMSRHVTLLNAAYFRKYHSELSRRYIDLWEDGLKIDLGHSGLIQPRLVKLLGRICELHTFNSNDVLTLDYQSDGFGTDYAHPRFIAMLLRLGDLLDADNGRFSSTATMTIGSLPDSSVPHRDKHESTVHLLVTPTDIEFRSNCPNQESYLETRNFISWLESEIDFLKKYWDIIAPKNLGGYVPRFDKKEVLINGVPDIEGVAGLRFTISQEKAFQIVEGSNIYCDPFICFREIVQNALDASKIQMWKDLMANNYIAWMGDRSITSGLQPFQIEQSIYKNYAIQIKLSTLPDGRTQVEISDRGTGISVESFKRMCNVGVSVSSGDLNENLVASMPAWLKPTAGFGIGLQSIFLLTDQFEILTSTGIETYQATVHSNRTGGFLQLRRQQDIIPRGTTIKLKFNMPSSYKYDMFGETMRYLYGEYDPFTNANYIGEIRTIESIRKNCSDTIFPLMISSSIEQYKLAKIKESVIANDTNNWSNVWNNYYYQLLNDCSEISVWDTEHHVHGKVALTKRRHAHTEICFKGIQVSGGFPRFTIDALLVELDIYGLETKETLSLDRASLISPGNKKVAKIMDDIVEFYIQKVTEELSKSDDRLKEICSNHKFDTYAFWQACSPIQRKRLPDKYLDFIAEDADILKKDDEGVFRIATKPAKDIIRELTAATVFANVSKFEDISQKRSDKYTNICSILNEHPQKDIHEVVVDYTILKATEKYRWSSMAKPENTWDLVLYSISDNDTTCTQVTEELQKELLRSLGDVLQGASYENFSTAIGKRFAIPAITGYDCIIVGSLPFGISRPNFNTNWIISPFTSNYREEARRTTKEEFVDLILGLDSFGILVEYIKHESVFQENASDANIRNAYKRLIEEYYDAMN